MAANHSRRPHDGQRPVGGAAPDTVAVRGLDDGDSARARDILAGRITAAVPRDAATVLLVRQGAPGLEVYLLRRVPSMSFAPGMHVFPGGAVDPRDSDRHVGWAGPAPREWARLLDTDEALARALVCAAVRETFEESGVLLAGASATEVVADTRGDDWEADRQALIDHSLSFAEFLDRRGLLLRSDLLRPWSRWVTPWVKPRRFDTRFFVAVLPEGQQTRNVGGEADHVVWLRPADAVRRWRTGELAMMTPTAVNLNDLGTCATCEDVLAVEREIVPVQPELRDDGGEITLVLPDSVNYPF